MKTMELYDKIVEVATNKTPNRTLFGVLQLNNLVNNALAEGMNPNVVEEVLKDALNSCGKIYL